MKIGSVLLTRLFIWMKYQWKWGVQLDANRP